MTFNAIMDGCVRNEEMSKAASWKIFTLGIKFATIVWLAINGAKGFMFLLRMPGVFFELVVGNRTCARNAAVRSGAKSNHTQHHDQGRFSKWGMASAVFFFKLVWVWMQGFCASGDMQSAFAIFEQLQKGPESPDEVVCLWSKRWWGRDWIGEFNPFISLSTNNLFEVGHSGKSVL